MSDHVERIQPNPPPKEPTPKMIRVTMIEVASESDGQSFKRGPEEIKDCQLETCDLRPDKMESLCEPR